MPVFVGSVADVGLDYLAFAGKVSRREALAFPARVEAEHRDGAPRWLTVFHREADLSELDIDCMLGIKAGLKPIVARVQSETRFRMILVADSPGAERVVARWREMTVPDRAYASKPQAAHSIAEACRLHGLTSRQILAAEAEIRRDFRDLLGF